jgi:MATE family multidrug resistance protein
MLTLSDIEQKETNEVSNKLTRHPIGSLRELCTLAFPLMLSALSGTIMLFIDRLVLAHYNTHVMNAAAAAGVVFAIFQFGSLSVAAIAEVFVGQYNGAKKLSLIAKPVWQMIWFSLMTAPIFIILGIVGPPWLLPQEVLTHEQGFFSWLMFFGPIFPLNAALASFYIGRGKVRLVTASLVLSSLINLVLDILLVFGLGALPAMGAKGAAIATGTAQVANACILLIPFLGKSSRMQYGSNRWQFDVKMFLHCLKIGVPNAVGHMVAIAAWAMVTALLAKTSYEHITLFAISQSIWILLTFITDGNQKAVSAVSANLIGAGQIQSVTKVFKSGIGLMLTLAILLAIPLIAFSDYLVQGFLTEQNVTDESLRALAILSCKWIWLAFLFENTTWIVAGILTSAGDTRFIMVMNAFNAWFFGVLPFYVLVNYFNAPASITMYLLAGFSFINMLTFLNRYWGKKWQRTTRASLVLG